MQITSGSDWLAPGGVNRRVWHISLDDTDGVAITGEDAWDEMSWTHKKAFLTMRADLEVILYMYKQDAITLDFMKDRAAKVKADYEAAKKANT